LKIAIATKGFEQVSTHAGRAREWLVYDCGADHDGVPEPRRVALSSEQIFHRADDAAPHPLDGVEIVVARSAGDGFSRHMARRGAELVLTAESDPRRALQTLLAGRELPAPKQNLMRVVCKVRDLFSRH